MRVVVVGGDAAGMSAASQLRRIAADAVSIDVLEQQEWTSYSACGIPYWIGGEVAGPDALVARTPQGHRANGINVHTGWRAERLDVSDRTVHAVEPRTGAPRAFPYDHLILAMGARPAAPPIPGLDAPGVYRVQTLDEGQAIIDALQSRPRRAVVLGAGYIGLEMAEAARSRGMSVTVLDPAAEPMTTLDHQMGALVREALTQRGVTVRMGEGARAIVTGPDGHIRAVASDTAEYPADLVFLGLGVVPRTELAHAAGLPLGAHGGLLTDDHQRVEGHPDIWAGGDCTEVTDRLTGQRRYVPLGTHANKHGRVIGLNIGGVETRFPGVLGTAITRFEEVEIARTGLSTHEAEDVGIDVAATTVTTTTRAGYMPGAQEMRVRMLADRADGVVIGVQVVGGPGAGARINTAAMALWSRMTVAELVQVDLSYAPPFSPVWDPVQTAARVLLAKL